MAADRTDAAGAVYTHGHHDSVLRSHRSRTVADSAAYVAPHLRPGMAVLDVGCGPATITVDLAQRVAPGPVTATEISDATTDIARRVVREHRADNVTVERADVHALPFADDSFDVVHAHQVLQHVGDPVQALREMRRVCRPGGLVAARDADYAAFTWWPALPELDEWLRLYRVAALRNGGQPDAGRRLLAWAHAAGFTDVTATASTWCRATPEAREAWGGMWAERILHSDLTAQLIEAGDATQSQLQSISDAWRAWVAEPDGWFTLLHGEILARA